MIQYAIEIRPTAENDLEVRYRQIFVDAPHHALAWYLGIMDAIQTLSSMPERCPLAIEDVEFNIGIRHLVVGAYRVLFFLDGDTVIVLHVRHSAMDRVL